MKKNKVYFGKQHLDHNEGRRNGKFVVPRMFHRYFELRHKLTRWNVILKMACNGSHGAHGHNMRVSTEHFSEMVSYRQRISKTLQHKLGVTRMQRLLDSIEAYRDAQAKQDTLVREVATRGYYDGVKKLDHTIDLELVTHCGSDVAYPVTDPAIPSPPSMEAFTAESLKQRREAKASGHYDIQRPGHCELYPGNLTQCLTDQCRVHPK